ncbi:hypothetical protein Q0Z83_060610 [Actinoplanes sichuanensis]|uniref:PEP-CTERM protein-sorting domain-containing protein n=1 Tax=Actinoplanes sichuanensis TaxID=512349 RepID=A0ABW4A6C0_9ACTN|nr:hypothetical protein [Actinoplanes sichuanensis]BEL07870.1 hypothetical protein Q0Z83_060610 [Actinoplanes sichuanensis]
MITFLAGAVAVLVTLAGLVVAAAVAVTRKRNRIAAALVTSAGLLFTGAVIYLVQLGEAGAR